MPSTYSPLLRLELIGAGEQSGLWGDTTNKNLGQLIEQAVAGVTTVSLSGGAGDYTLTALDGTYDEARSAVLKFIGNPSGIKNIIIPTETKLYVVRNDCGQVIRVKTAAQVTGVTLLNGEATLVFCDGTNAVAGIATAGVGPTTVSNGGTGATSFAGGFIKSPGGTGTLTSSLFVNAATELSGAVGVGNGGTGATTFGGGGILKSSGGAAAITASAVNLNSGDVTAVLQPINGGTGLNTLGINSVLLGNGINQVQAVAPGANGNVLTSNGTTWISQAPATSGGTVTSVGFSTGTTGLSVIGTNPITSSGTFTLSGILSVGSGGTGVGALTGIVKGNGTGVFTAATGSDITTAIGAFAVQNASYAATAGSATSASTATTANSATTAGSVTNGVYTVGDQTIGGTKTFSSTIVGSVNGNAGTVTNGVYTTGNQTIGGNKTFSGVTVIGSPGSTGAAPSINSTAYNFASTTSIYFNGTQVFITISGNNQFKFDASGDFTIAGQGYKPGGGSWAATSDARLKTDVQDLTGALDKIASLRPVSYGWKYGTGDEPTVGFIAQEVQSVLPNAVVESNPTEQQKPFIPDGEKALNIGWQNDMTAYLVGAIKELKAEVDALKAQLAAR
jgi:hypothetical protein